jgi:hypothetical protein
MVSGRIDYSMAIIGAQIKHVMKTQLTLRTIEKFKGRCYNFCRADRPFREITRKGGYYAAF